MRILEKTMVLDRRIIFLLIAVAVVVPLFIPFHLKMHPTPASQGLYDAVEKLSKGSTVIISGEYDPGTAPEIQPMVKGALKHCFRKGIKVILMGLWPQGPALEAQALQEVLEETEFEEMNLQYGQDYVNLGYKAGGQVVIQSMGTSIPATFPTDMAGTPIEELSLMKEIRNFDDITFILDFSAGDPGTPFWVMFAHDRFHVPMASGCTAVSAPMLYPYLQTGQLAGLLGGLKGAADYEWLTKSPGTGIQYMPSQSIAHLVIVIFIILGNIAFFVTRKKGER